MNRLVYSALGRQLWSSDWMRIHGDTVLKVLYDFRASPFNPQNKALDETNLHHATGLAPQDLRRVLGMLISEGQIEETPASDFRITDQGFAFVASTPAITAGMGSFGTGSLG